MQNERHFGRSNEKWLTMKLTFVALAAVLSAPAALAASATRAARQVEAAPAPEATPLVSGRMFEHLDEGGYLRARDVANVAAPQEVTTEDNHSTALLAAVPFAAAAVGVVAFAAYRRSSQQEN